MSGVLVYGACPPIGCGFVLIHFGTLVFISSSIVCSDLAPGSVLSNGSGGSWMTVAPALVMWAVSARRPHPPTMPSCPQRTLITRT